MRRTGAPRGTQTPVRRDSRPRPAAREQRMPGLRQTTFFPSAFESVVWRWFTPHPQRIRLHAPADAIERRRKIFVSPAPEGRIARPYRRGRAGVEVSAFRSWLCGLSATPPHGERGQGWPGVNSPARATRLIPALARCFLRDVGLPAGHADALGWVAVVPRAIAIPVAYVTERLYPKIGVPVGLIACDRDGGRSAV
jgi:hypothetical protein